MEEKKLKVPFKAYKIFNPDWTCLEKKYEVGKEYKEEKISMCKYGMHACLKLLDCFNYYSFSPKNKVAEVLILGDFEVEKDDSKTVTNHMKIEKELKWQEVLELCNSGSDNSGHSNSGSDNSGSHNSGSHNSGSHNSGHYNSGSYNSGFSNSGHYNSGSHNSGSHNSGHYNSGPYNSGYGNSGSHNSGSHNSGSHNSGSDNSGSRNSGSDNSGYSNSGSYNSGSHNSGSHNSGHYNSGSYNSGYGNSGSHNSGSHNSGIFNIDKPDKYRVFGKWITREEYENIYFPDFLFFPHVFWTNEKNATEEEKEKYKEEIKRLDGGFLKTLEYKEAFKLSWKKADKIDREKIREIPGFNKKIFYDISGIDVDKD